MKILVTGSSGMVGTALCKELKKEHEVYGIDIKEGEETSDLIDLRFPFLCSFEPDLVIHLAATARVYKTVIDPQIAFDNISMTNHILEWTKRNKIPKFILASSRECYGNQTELPVPEIKANQRNSESPYTASKIAGEAMCYAFEECYGLDFKILRFSNVYGKYDTSDRFIPKLMHAIRNNEDFTIYGERKALSFTYIDDCISGILHVIKYWVNLPNELNVSAEGHDRLVDVAYMIKDMTGSPINILIGETLTGEVWDYIADISEMRKTGWSPKNTLAEGIKKSIEYYGA